MVEGTASAGAWRQLESGGWDSLGVPGTLSGLVSQSYFYNSKTFAVFSLVPSHMQVAFLEASDVMSEQIGYRSWHTITRVFGPSGIQHSCRNYKTM